MTLMMMIILSDRPDLMLGTDPGHRPLLSAVVQRLVSVAVISPVISLVIEARGHLIPMVRIMVLALQVEVTHTPGRRVVREVKVGSSLSLTVTSAGPLPPLLLQVTQSLTHKPDPRILDLSLRPQPGLVLQILPQDDLLA